MSRPRLAAIETEVSIGAPIESSGRPPTWSRARTPSRNSKRRGTTSIATPASRQARIDSSSSSWLAREKAMITRSMFCASMIASRSLKRPSQGRSGVPTSCTSSSTMPTGTRPNWTLLWSFLTTWPATMPEPRIRVRWRRSGARCRPARTTARAQPAKTAVPATVRKVRATTWREAEDRGDAEQRPGDQQHGDEAARDLGDGGGPGRELVAAVEADAEGGERPEQPGAEDVGETGGGDVCRAGGRRARRRRTRPARRPSRASAPAPRLGDAPGLPTRSAAPARNPSGEAASRSRTGLRSGSPRGWR